LHGRASATTVILLLALVVGLTWSNPGSLPLSTAATPPNSPYKGTGSALDVHEFARNDSVSFAGGTNDSAFSYMSGWYPAGYLGYRLHTDVGNVRLTTDPVPNGNFEQFDEPGNNWSLMDPGTGGLVQSIDNVTGGNPGYCLDTQLKYNNVPNNSTARIENDFFYGSSVQPDIRVLEFDIRFSADITSQSWLRVKVSVEQGSTLGSWSNTTDPYNPTSWEHHSFNTGPLNNGSVILRITIQKAGGGNAKVNGHIYFDNFRYTLSSSRTPGEVGLALNGTAFVNSGGGNGSVDIYGNPVLKERASPINCWSATQQFQFSSAYGVTFSYRYSMYIKMENPGSASTFFTAPADGIPTWVANYTIPGGRPPSGYTGYRFGLFLPSEWSLSVVKNFTGDTIFSYSYDALNRFFLLNENVGVPGQTFSIYASSPNHILQIYVQRGPTSSGPWINITSVDFFVAGDYLRVFARLEPIEAIGNLANVSVFFPNGTLWRSDSAPVFDANLDALASVAWQVPAITQATAGDDWLATVSFNTATQCGMRTQPFAAYIEPKGSFISPAPGSRHLWGSTVFVNVTWRNNATLAYVPGAAAGIHYFDRYSQPQYATMSSNGQGAYFTSIATSLLKPSRTAELHVEFFKVGYVNASYADGTHLTFTVNLVNDLDYAMVRPVQSIGPDEYEAQTTVNLGYTVQARLYDPFEVQYARNDTLPWAGAIRFNCSRYEDTGSGWVFVGTGSFLPNSTDPTLFEKADASYPASVLRVKYAVTARLVGASCDYQQQNFTIVLQMVAFGSNLDALRTIILHPPSGTGDGWTVFNTPLDAYQVHLYFGQILNLTVYYENVSAMPHRPILDASVNVYIAGSWLPLTNRGNGYYAYTLDTLVLSMGVTHMQVNASRVDCAAQTIVIEVVIQRIPSQLKPVTSIIDVTWGDTFWVVVYYNDTLNNQPIIGAPIQYHWGALSGTMTAGGVAGWYNVSLPTATQTAGSELLNLTVAFGDYEGVALVLSVNIKTRTTQMTVDSIEASYLSAGVIVPLTGTRFSVPVTDVLVIRLNFTEADGTPVSNATALFSWQWGDVPLSFVNGQYLLQLNLGTVPPGSYPFSILLTRQNYQSKSLTGYQLDVILVPTAISGIDNVVAQLTGQPFSLVVHFDDTYHGLGIVGANLTATIPSLGLFSVKMVDNGDGSYRLANLTYAVDGIFDVDITAQGSSLYAVAQRRVSLVVRLSGQGSSLFSLLPLAVAVAALVLISGFLAYTRVFRPRVLVPRLSVRKQKLQDVADMFNDVVNLSRFLVLHRGSGIAIFDPFSERGMDAALFGGFLQAISAFAVDVARTTEDEQLPLASPLHEITYEGFRILIHDGRFVRTALVFKGQPSENLKKKMEEFTTRFEAKYFKELGEWCCEPEVFQDATVLLEDIFHVTLLLPHKVQPKLPSTQPLTDIESKLYGIALALTQERDSALLHEVIKAYTTAFKADKLEVLNALYQLREKKLLLPIEFYRLTKKAREQLAPEPKTPAKKPSK